MIELANVTVEFEGETFRYNTANIWRVQDGKMVEARAHISDLYAWDDFWTKLATRA